MSRPRRLSGSPPGTYFCSTQTSQRLCFFRNERKAKLLIETLYHYRSAGKYLLHAFVVMPDHLHVLITPEEITLERAMQFIKGGYSHRVSVEQGDRSEIWQKGFTDHRIRDAEDARTYLSYLKENPVKARLCLESAEYPYSSANRGFEVDELPAWLMTLG